MVSAFCHLLVPFHCYRRVCSCARASWLNGFGIPDFQNTQIFLIARFDQECAAEQVFNCVLFLAFGGRGNIVEFPFANQH